MSEHKDEDVVRGAVRDRYAKAAKTEASCCGTAALHAAATRRPQPRRYRLGSAIVTRNWRSAPEGANLGLGCGNPQAIADLKPGEVVVDLGSGAGFDCFLAARAVGPTGRVIGVDMTPEMVASARENARKAGTGSCRVPSGGDRAPSGRRRIRRCHHLQLRDQPLARQAGRIPGRVSGAQARRPARGERRGGHSGTPRILAGRHAPAVGMYLGGGGRRHAFSNARGCRVRRRSTSGRRRKAASSSASGSRRPHWRTTSSRPRSVRRNR